MWQVNVFIDKRILFVILGVEINRDFKRDKKWNLSGNKWSISKLLFNCEENTCFTLNYISQKKKEIIQANIIKSSKRIEFDRVVFIPWYNAMEEGDRQNRRVRERLKMRGFLYELDYYEVVRHSRSGINGAQSEGSHLPRNRDNNDLPTCLLCSFPVRFSPLPCATTIPIENSKLVRIIPTTLPDDPKAPRPLLHVPSKILNSVVDWLAMRHREIIRSEKTHHKSRADNLLY